VAASEYLECLEAWRKESRYDADDDLLFPSTRKEGKQPITPDMVLKKVIRRALKRAKVTGKVIGWHNFRHSPATDLESVGGRLENCPGTPASHQLSMRTHE
jgi:integrase